MLSQINPQNLSCEFKSFWFALFLGSESDSGSSHLTRSSQLAAPRLGRAGAHALGRWIVIVRPTFARNGALSISCQPSDQNPTAGLRRPPLAFAHARGRHGVSRGVGSASSRPLRAGQRLPLRAFIARRAPLPKVVVSPAPVAQLAQGRAGTEAHP